MNTAGQWSKQEACFARATPVRLAVNHKKQCHVRRMNSMFEASESIRVLKNSQSSFKRTICYGIGI